MHVKKKHVLQDDNILKYFGSQLISLTGSMMQTAILSLAIVAKVGAEKAPPLIGNMLAYGLIPGVFLALPAGLLLDSSSSKRLVLQITAIFGIAVALVFAFLARGNLVHISMWQINALALFMGFINAVDGVGRNAIIKDAIRDPSHGRAAAIYFTSLYTFGQVLGNGTAGYLVLSIGYSWSFTINALSFVVLIIGLAKMDFSHVEKKTKADIRELLKKGWHEIIQSKIIRICIILAGVIVIFGFSYNGLLAIVAKTMFGGGPKEYSKLAMAGGMGSLTGIILAAVIEGRTPKTLLVGGCLLTGTSLMLFPYCHSLHVAQALLFCCGFGFMISFSTVRSEILHHTSRPLVSVVLGFTFIAFYGGMAGGFSAAGYLAKQFGCPNVMAGCGFILVVTGTIARFLPGISEIGAPVPVTTPSTVPTVTLAQEKIQA